MEYTQLGKSDLHISRVGFGCMSLKGPAEDNKAIIHRALDMGINYFDTADLYDKGNNETMLGNLLKDHRNDIVIATKAGNQWRADGSGWDWNASKAYILSAAEASLKRLGRDHIDLYQLHGGTLEDPIDDTIEAFEILKQQGKIRWYGISSIRPNVIREYVQRSNIASVMMQYSLLDRRPEETCFELLERNNISLLARGCLAQGLLVDKPAKPYLSYTEQAVNKAAKAVQAIAGGEHSNAQVALAFTLQQRPVASAVVGIRTMQQLEDVVVSSHVRLTDEEMEVLKNAIPPSVYDQHR
jgi:aryl-alcohol dehydrogenase-like predicted oxidoreductase